MHTGFRALAAFTTLGAFALPALGQDAVQAPQARVLGTHHIDRHYAIEQVRQSLLTNPKNLNDWIILGELAQEVAADSPGRTAASYYRLARQSYESALILKPNDPALKAAARFAADQERGAERLTQTRRQATGEYLAARRRELAQPGSGPTVRVYQARPDGAQRYYYYQPYTGAGRGAYTFQEHSRDFFPGRTEEGVPIEARAGQTVTATEAAALVKPASGLAPP